MLGKDYIKTVERGVESKGAELSGELDERAASRFYIKAPQFATPP